MIARQFALGMRRAVRAPAFFALAVASLGLALAAALCGAVLLRSVLVNDLPYARAQDVVRIGHVHAERGPTFGAFSYDDYRDVAALTAFEGVAGVWHSPGLTVANAVIDGAAMQVEVAYVSANFFDVLAPDMLQGSGYSSSSPDPDVSQAVVVSAGAWTSLFGRRADVVGRRITINGFSYSVVGVAREEASYPSPSVQLWLPLAAVGAQEVPRNRSNRWLDVIARVPDTTRIGLAKSQLDGLLSRLSRQYPDSNARYGTPLLQGLFESTVGDWRQYAAVISVAAVLALLVACANFVSLFRTRLAGRGAADAVQSSLGVRPVQLLCQRAGEIALILACATTLGTLSALVAMEFVRSLGATFPRQGSLAIAPLGWFAILVVTNVACSVGGLFALTARGSSAQTRAVQGRVRSAFLAIQIAVVFALLYGSLLVASSFARLAATPLGFSLEDRITFRVRLPGENFDSSEQVIAARQQMLDRLSAVPGVISVAASKTPVLGQVGERYGVLVDESRKEWGTPEWGFVMVSADYALTLGMTTLQGEMPRAVSDPTAALPVAVNEAFVRRYFDGIPVLGRELRTGLGRAIRISAVVRDVRHLGPAVEPRPAIYAPFVAFPRTSFSVVVHTNRYDLIGMEKDVRAAIGSVDSQVGASSIDSLTSAANRLTSRLRMLANAFLGFVAMSTLVAACGLFASMTLAINESVREFAVRAALGASPAGQVRRVYSYVLAQSLGGILAGGVLALGLGKFVASALPDVAGFHPFGMLLAFGVLASVVLAAGVQPAWRVHRLSIARTLAA